MIDLEKMREPYESFAESLDYFPFIVIIGKYDQILGPQALFSSVDKDVKNKEFFRDLLRDALNTKNKFVILDFNKFYAQVCKVEVEDKTARGGKQLYALILLRHVEHPIIPILHLKRIEMMFLKIGNQNILKDDIEDFQDFFEEINDIYIKKDEILPLESVNLQIRSGVTTIQGFCELMKEQIKSKELTDDDALVYIDMLLDSCKEIVDALEKPIENATK